LVQYGDNRGDDMLLLSGSHSSGSLSPSTPSTTSGASAIGYSLRV
jgi:hypothetical protein